MKHMRKFQTQLECEAYINSEQYVEPFVGLVAETREISYNKIAPPSLTFNITSPGTIVWKTSSTAFTKTISYSTDSGATWTDITSNTGSSAPTINVNAGDKVMFKGNNAAYCDSSYRSNSFSGSTAGFEVEGNIMSLIDSTGFTTATTLTSAYTFYCLFRGCTGLTSAENLVLPATTLANYCYNCMFYNCTALTTAPSILPATTLSQACYNGMFQNCSSLTTAPELPATTLPDYCYSYMFNGCSSLNYIKCLATDISASNCTSSWVYGVASSGTFVKNSNMSSWTTGDNGIPTGWTVQDAS